MPQSTSSSSMSTSMQTMESAQRLVRQGPQLLSQLYSLKARLLALDHRELYLKDAAWSKLRHKLEKKFPALPDLAKIPGGDHFLELTSTIQVDLTPCFEVFGFVAAYLSEARKVLEKIPKMVYQFKMRRNKPILVLWAELFVCFMKVHHFLELLPEKFALLPMYAAASRLNGAELSPQKLEEMRALLHESDDFRRHCIDVFCPLHAQITEIISEMREVIIIANDAEALRDQNIFNPINEGLKMGLPSSRTVNAGNPLLIHTELISLDLYYEFVAFAALACPQSLADEQLFSLLAEVANYRALLPIYRDMSLNLHIELEKMSLAFPSETEKALLPQSFRLPSRLKHLAREALPLTARRQRQRRRILEDELLRWTQLLQVTPALVAPKLPIVLSAAALLKSEILAFFRHYYPFAVRKDCRAYYQASYFQEDAEDLGRALYVLYLVENILQRSETTIVNYYLEFLFRADLESLQTCESLFLSSALAAPLVRHYEGLCSQVESFHLYHCEDTHEIAQIAARIDEEYLRLLLLASHASLVPAVNTHAVDFERFSLAMYRVQEHCSFVAEAQLLACLARHVNPFEVGWFRPAIRAVFSASLSPSQSSAAATGSATTVIPPSSGVFSCNTQPGFYAFLYFRPFADVLYNLESATNEFSTAHGEREREREREREVKELGEAAVRSVDALLAQSRDFVLSSLQSLCDYVRALEAQYHPSEVAQRLQRALQGSTEPHTLTQAHTQFSPGMESDLWATPQIEDFVRLQTQLSSVLQGAHKTIPAALQVYTRMYRVEQFLAEETLSFCRTRTAELFLSLDTSCFLRFSLGLSRLLHCLHGMQFVAQSLPCGPALVHALQSIVCERVSPADAVPPIGLSALLGGAVSSHTHTHTEDVRETVAGRAAQWFRELSLLLSRPSSEIVFSPHTRTFVNLRRWRQLATSSACAYKTNVSVGVSGAIASLSPTSGEFAADMFLARDELVALAHAVGPQGVRVIEAELLDIVAASVIELSFFAQRDAEALELFAQNAVWDAGAAVARIAHLDQSADLLRSIAIALILRDKLLEAAGVAMKSTDHDMFSSLQSLSQALDSWADSALHKHALFHTLCSSVGVAEDARDISLFSAVFESVKGRMSFADVKWLYVLLPSLCAALAVSPRRWSGARFLTELSAFENNEHVLQIGAAKLLVLVHNLLSAGLMAHCQSTGADFSSLRVSEEMFRGHAEDGEDTETEELFLFERLHIDEGDMLDVRVAAALTHSHTHGEDSIAGISPQDVNAVRGSSERDCAAYITQRYLRLAAEALLSVQAEGLAERHDLPLPGLLAALQQFVALRPAGISPGHLQQFLPYEVVHASLVGLSLGKQRPSDRQELKLNVKSQSHSQAPIHTADTIME